MSHFDICLNQKIFFSLLLAIFSIFPSTQTIKVIGLIFKKWADLQKLGYAHAVQYITLRPVFRMGGGVWRQPSAIQWFRTPIVLKYWNSSWNLKFGMKTTSFQIEYMRQGYSSENLKVNTVNITTGFRLKEWYKELRGITVAWYNE